VIEMSLLEESKETDNKVRWDADIDGTRFSLYIPKWRVPEPWPRVIQVSIHPDADTSPTRLSRVEAHRDPTLRLQPIVTYLRRFKEHTKTIRYRPELDREKDEWEIGEPYVPIEMTFGGAERLTLTVNWLK